MSTASRAREVARRQLYLRRSFPDWETFRAWQAATLAALCGPWLPFDLRPPRQLMAREHLVAPGTYQPIPTIHPES